tara:strand:- start:12867 stop:13460 length:594 start_codon:yes stop_codon:yes gene_type:complete
MSSLTPGFGAADTPAETESEGPALDNYLLAPFDSVAVTVFDEPDLATTQRITARGEITVPLLGTVTIGGLSIEEAKESLAKSFVEEEFLRAPEVFVTIEEFSPKRITVLGEVSEPSSFSLPMGANYLEVEAAIAMAGGFTDIAKKSSIRVTRKASDGREKVSVIDMDDVLTDDSDGFATTRFKIFPGDILYVPRRYF